MKFSLIARAGLVLMLLLVIGAPGQGDSENPGFGGELPLWEPPWSPTVLLPGATMHISVDSPEAICIADIDGDGVKELIVGGDYLHEFSFINGELSNFYLTALVGEGQHVTGGQSLKVQVMAAGDLDNDSDVDLVVGTKTGNLWVFLNNGPWGFRWASGSPHHISGEHILVYDYTGDGNLDIIVAGYEKLHLLIGDGQGGMGQPFPLDAPTGRVGGSAIAAYRGSAGFFILSDDGLWFFAQGKNNGLRIIEGGGRKLAVADFNSDGTVDVAIGSHGKILVHLGGEGGFGDPQTWLVDHAVRWLLSADFNGDGFIDLAAGSSSPAGFSIYYNRGVAVFSGPYQHRISIPVLGGLPASAPRAIAADFTGDGSDDIAVVAWPYHLAFFTSAPSGHSPQAIPGSFLLGARDMNNDGSPDLLASSAQGGVDVLINSGFGTFKFEPLIGSSAKDRLPYIIQFGDLTGDGADELITFEFARDLIWIPQPGKPSWQWPRARSNARATVWSMATHDVLWSEPLGADIRPLLILSDQTEDGIKDVVTAAGDKVIILSYSGDKPLRQEIPWGGPVGPLALVQLDGKDIVAGFQVGLEIKFLILAGGRVQTPGITLQFSPLDLVAGDMNNDGNQDLVTIGLRVKEEADTPKLVMEAGILWGDGVGGFTPMFFPLSDWPITAIPFPYGGLTLGDLNGDGILDIAVMRLPNQEGTPGGIVVLPGTGSGIGRPVFLPGSVGTRLLALDVDSDSRAELITVESGLSPRLLVVTWR